MASTGRPANVLEYLLSFEEIERRGRDCTSFVVLSLAGQQRWAIDNDSVIRRRAMYSRNLLIALAFGLSGSTVDSSA